MKAKKLKFDPQNPRKDECVADGYYIGEKHILHKVLKDGILTKKCLRCSFGSTEFTNALNFLIWDDKKGEYTKEYDGYEVLK